MRSLKARLFITLFVNLSRSSVSFIVGVFLARGLGAYDYGVFVFLLGSFTSIRTLLELGSSTAFFTFISQRVRPIGFILSYTIWQVIQLVLSLIILSIVVTDEVISLLWIGQNRQLVLLALVGSFLMLQGWQTILQIGDAYRLTAKIQVLNLIIAIVHLILILFFWLVDCLTIQNVFYLIIFEYLIAILISFYVLKNIPVLNEPFNLTNTISEYIQYCKPLVVYSFLSFFYGFLDNWLLQRYGGASERAYYAAALQISTICLLITNAVLPLFWKEMAEAYDRNNKERVKSLYIRVTRLVFIGSAFLGSSLLPWCHGITVHVFGDEYLNGAMSIGLMFFFPAYASIGQIIGTMFISTGSTKIQVNIGIATMCLGILFSYIAIAPVDIRFPGLELGSVGMAIKTLLITVVSTNFMAWFAARINGWKFDWFHQIIIFGVTLGISYFSFLLVYLLNQIGTFGFYVDFACSMTLNLVLIIYFVIKFPALSGLTNGDIEFFKKKFIEFKSIQ